VSIDAGRAIDAVHLIDSTYAGPRRGEQAAGEVEPRQVGVDPVLRHPRGTRLLRSAPRPAPARGAGFGAGEQAGL